MFLESFQVFKANITVVSGNFQGWNTLEIMLTQSSLAEVGAGAELCNTILMGFLKIKIITLYALYTIWEDPSFR